MSYALIIRENVAFRKTNEISMSRSTWTVTLIVDLKPYKSMLENSLDNLNKIKSLFENRRKKFHLDKFNVHFQLLEKELSLLNTNRQNIIKSFSQLEMFQSRHKRSIFPFIGDIISFIAGTPSENDLKAIRSNIDTLNDNQAKIQHVVKQSLSLINMTHDKMVENRKRINQIGSGMNKLLEALKSVQNELHVNINWNEFLDFYLKLNGVINNARELILEQNFFMEELQTQINLLSLGKITPITIKPKKLKETLITISEKLPESLRLPFNPKTHIWNYYRMLTCSVVFENDRILVVINVPLINRGTQFEVFKIYNVAIPSVAISKQLPLREQLGNRHLVANYKLEATALAINQQRTDFVIMSEEEAKLCSNPLVSFCKFKSPIYPVNKNTFCLVALFIGSQSRIKQLCQAKVYTNVNLPNAEYISDGLWLVTTAKRLTFTRTCQEPSYEPKTFFVEPPLSLVRMKETCTATNNELTLQPFYKIMSELKMGIDFEMGGDVLNGTSFSNIQLWEPVNHVIQKINLSYQYRDLPDIEEMKMEHLVKEINSLQEVKIIEKSFWQKYQLVIIGSILIFGFIFFALIISNYRKGFRFWQKNFGKNVSDSGIVDSPTGRTDKTGRAEVTDSPSDEIELTSDNRRRTQRQPDTLPFENNRGIKRKRSCDNLLSDDQQLEGLLSTNRSDSFSVIQPYKYVRRDMTEAGKYDANPLKNLLP